VVAFRLPNLFRRILGEGALSVSFIPVFNDYLKKGDLKGAKELASAVFTLLFVVLSILTVLGTWQADWLVNAFSDGFSNVPGKVDLTIHQTRIMFCYIGLVSLYAFGMGILNGLRVFWIPAFAPALWNLAMIIGSIFFNKTFEIPSDVLAWSTVAGGVLQLAILLPPLIQNRMVPRLRAWWSHPGVRQVLRAMGPSILGLSVMQLAVLINTHFASKLEEGANYWIFTADRLMELPLSLFAVSIGTAALPTLSSLWSNGDREGMSRTSLHALKLSLFMALPCAVGLYFLAEPIVRILLEHGHFTPHDTVMIGSVIKIYGFGIIFATGVRVLAPAFYATKDTSTPAQAAVIALVCHVFLAYNLTKIYGVMGLAASSVLSGLINLTYLVARYQAKIHHLSFRELFKSVMKFVVASVALGAATQSFDFFSRLFGVTRWGQLLSLSFCIGVSGTCFFVVAFLLKTPELTETVGEFYKRIHKKLVKI
jgi:putative peptidoglycan lipid II flippase